MIGSPYAAYEGDTDVSAVRLMEVLCHGADASTVCLAGGLGSLEEVPGFWTRYKLVGRCAIDTEDKMKFVDSERYAAPDDIQTYQWCGQLHPTAT